jgi:putative ATP-binding cassette transporter
LKHLRLALFLIRNSRTTAVVMVCTGLLSGLLSVGVIAMITRALTPADGPGIGFALAFAMLVLAKVATGSLSQVLLGRFTQGTILDLSLTLCRRILNSPLRQVEVAGTGRIMTILTDDVSSLTWAVQCVPTLASNIAVIAGCGAYLAWLSWEVFVWAAAVTALGALAYKVMNDRARRTIAASREARSRLLGHFSTLIGGIKELLLHRSRREAFLTQDLSSAADDYRRSNMAATQYYAIAEAWIQFLLYGLIGSLLFVYPLLVRVEPHVLTAYVFAILYLMGPLWTVIGAVPAIVRGEVALDRIESLGLSLTPDEAPGTDQKVSEAPHVVSMQDMTFEYESANGHGTGFRFGPVNFTLHSGELVFVVGGNGSGKSTFAKLLTGLYRSETGELRLDDRPVGRGGLAMYREQFSAVFSDFHLFDRLLGLDRPDLDAAANHYLEVLRLQHKVRVDGGHFSTVEVSQGQRKRLALISAYLEDRPFYVFDEWAADQDPAYKSVFYTQLLPELRSRGKGVVVITHDDRYFHAGDRIFRFVDGKAEDMRMDQLHEV